MWRDTRSDDPSSAHPQLADLRFWRRAGHRAGRQHQSADVTPLRELLRETLLRDAWNLRRDAQARCAQWREQQTTTAAHLERMTASGGTGARHIAAVQSLATRAGALSARFTAEHSTMIDQISLLKNRAGVADATWRRAAQDARERRVTLPETDLSLPDDVLANLR